MVLFMLSSSFKPAIINQLLRSVSLYDVFQKLQAKILESEIVLK